MATSSRHATRATRPSAPAGTSPRREKITTSTRRARTKNTHGDRRSVGTPGGSVAIPFLGMATTATTLAADLGVDEGDIDVLLDLLDEHPPELPDELAAFLRGEFDPHGERTAPTRALLARRRPPQARGTYGLGGPDPTT